ncbi:MAG: MFS transporter [Kineosporiaceae bacterium]|nr:MFS transporter [Kineosporiaceae bacterium]
MSAQRLHRDAVTLTVYLALGGWAWFLYGFGAMVPLLVDEQGISRSVGGLHLTAQAAGALIAGLVVTGIVRRWNRRGTVQLAGGLILLGAGLLLAGRPTVLTLTALLVLGTGGSLAIICINPMVMEHHGRHGPAVLTEANAVAAGVGLIAPLAVGAGVRAGWGWRPALAVTAVLIGWVVLRLAGRWGGVPRPVPAVDSGLPPRGSASRPLPAAIWPLMVLVVVCIGVEFCLTTWTTELLRGQVGMSDSAAATGVSALVGGMAAGRVVISRLARRWTPRVLLAASIAVAAVGWLGLWTAQDPAIALGWLVVTGVGVGGHFPLGLALVMSAARGQQDRASGRMSIGVALGVGLAPFALGALSDATSVHTAFLIVPALLAIAAAILVASSPVSAVTSDP